MVSNTFIKRPVTAIVISLVLMIAGLICLFNLAVDQYPNISPPSVSVNGSYTGADAQTVEQNLATPIEEQVNGTPGMEYMTSTNTNSGSMGIRVTFKIGTNVHIAALNVQNRVGIATPLLPSVVSKLGLTVRASNPDQLMLVAIYSPKHTHSITFLDNYTNTFIQDAILRVPGVGDVSARTDNFSMRIWLNPDKMASYSLTPADVTAALDAQNVYVAAGSAGAPPQQSSQTFETGILVNGMLSKVSDYEKIVVKSIPGTGQLVYLKDVARVELGKFTFSSNAFVDGNRASTIQVYQSPGSNALQTAENVYAALAKLKKSFPKDVDYVVPFESITIIKVSMQEVIGTLIKALALVAIVVFLFLQNWRSTLIPILAIPVSILATFIFFIPLGFTINTLTMFGFVLAIGIVVDDAIIVVEAVQHYIDEKGLSPKEATYQAMKEIAAPVIAIALILASVFVPVGFIPGIVGRLYQQFAITIAISVMLSAFVALSLTPALCTLLLRPTPPVTEKSNWLTKFFDAFNKRFEKITLKYTNGVHRSIKGARYIVIILVCICVGTYLMFRIKPSGFVPAEDGGRLYVTYQLPEASSTIQSVNVMEKLMKIVASTPGILHYTAISGFNILNGGANSNNGSMFCMLTPWDDRTTPNTRVPGLMNVIKQKIAKAGIKNANVVVAQPPPIRGIGQAAGFSMQIEQGNTTDDIYAFEKVVKKFVAAAKANPATAGAYSYFSAHTPSYELNVDREKCEKLGINISDVFSTMQAYMGSLFVNNFTLYNRTYHVVVQADTAYRALISNMNKYYVRNSVGQMLPLSTVISYKPIVAAPLITHFNIFRSAEVDGSIPPGYSSGQAIEALKALATKTLPRGYTYEFSGLSYEEIKAGSTTIYIFLFSIVFVFLFLAALYESWSVPFSVMLAVPISAFGAILALTVVPTVTNNVYAQIGLITLIGLSAKNAILIVEFAKIRVDRGEELIKSTLEAVRLRLRPIIMTSLAFILGVLPLVLATGAGAESRNTIGITVLGGMIASSTISIFIVPVLFVLFTRFSYGKKQLAYLQEHHEELMEKARKVEAQNIDPELEYDIAEANEKHNSEKQAANDHNK
ncbi:hydrophobic/amphiphilic exporter-1, HAE1 family [Mucilaginibacter lappiensis]|uniref:HAE1 family hydrophobic/amphiphilic exporter-1 n=1 Tax=Mucilaginibacter lappiensis TaxID=354630 RepID=A0ABR6PHQ8_9SPHI|nr:efflux RND transporter permease subunit [Mucilaginibacter lappiensis]MBB6109191.1 HAE1 family hydrophobic/amphiphilic exporter-1 [Mucilaginibacter lappiensis]SIQ79380.1 hydrophobic/amphiphilic exporter-1, HAE1 family [Mucilaginibacter lappiensis]